MQLVSIRIITADVARLVGFYERVTGVAATWATDDFAELTTPRATLAIASTRTVAGLGPDALRPAENRSVVVELLAEDVDAVRERLHDLPAEVVMEPTTMPWGNRSFLVRDPDGTLVNLFTPVSPEAVAKYAR